MVQAPLDDCHAHPPQLVTVPDGESRACLVLELHARLLRLWAQRAHTLTAGWLPSGSSLAGCSTIPQHQPVEGGSS